jgi:hypothetical protein
VGGHRRHESRRQIKKPTVPAGSIETSCEEKQAPVPQSRFPNVRQAWWLKRKLYYWMRVDLSRMMILVSIFSGFPINGRPAVQALPVHLRPQRDLDKYWKEQFRRLRIKFRLSGLSISDYLKQEQQT